jgi:hypothetical protein
MAVDCAVAAKSFDVAEHLLWISCWCSSSPEFRRQMGQKAFGLIDLAADAGQIAAATKLLDLSHKAELECGEPVNKKRQFNIRAARALALGSRKSGMLIALMWPLRKLVRVIGVAGNGPEHS